MELLNKKTLAMLSFIIIAVGFCIGGYVIINNHSNLEDGLIFYYETGCRDILYNNGNGVDIFNMTTYQEYCLLSEMNKTEEELAKEQTPKRDGGEDGRDK